MPRTLLGRGWVDVPMVNNHEPVEPYGPGAAGEAVRAARATRRLTAVDGGRAWRRREGRVLAVLRLERFADEVPTGSGLVGGGLAAAHRTVWQEHGAACLEETWRARWIEREVVPGWIEARPLVPAARPDPRRMPDVSTDPAGPAAAVDWFRVEDHTGGGDVVTIYHHLSIWRSRSLATLSLRHDLGLDLEREAAAAAAAVHALLGA
ncbi:MAG: hypothetical protein JWM47_2440 [Acidimicrobiales bacterium]|nr:hypothetical protein [Acidimicrobiales bacterium]